MVVVEMYVLCKMARVQTEICYLSYLMKRRGVVHHNILFISVRQRRASRCVVDVRAVSCVGMNERTLRSNVMREIQRQRTKGTMTV